MHALLFGMALFASAQDQPDFHRGLEKSSFKVQLSERSWADCSLEFVYAGKVKGYHEQPCTRACEGKKHFQHEACDTSCDKACFQEKHTAVAKAFTTGGGAPFDSLEKGMQNFGESANPSVVKAYVDRRLNLAKDLNGVNFNWEHWNETPCSTQNRRYEHDAYDVVFTFALFRHDLTADGRQVLVTGPKTRTVEGQFIAPRNDFTTEKPIVNCQCEAVADGIPEDTEVGGVFLQGDQGMRPITGGEITGVGLEVACTSMTECSATFTNPTLGDVTCIINPGTVFECIGGSAQDEVSCERMEVKLLAGETKTVPLEVDGVADRMMQTVKGRFACLNMNKKEPRAGLKYRYGGAAPPDVTKLAFKTASSRIRGVPDQVRMWIVTDKASWPQVGKVLIPAPSRGMYVNCLYDVAIATGKPLTEPAYKACIDPSNIIGSRASADATDWFVDLWSGHKPEEFRTVLSRSWEDLKKDCFDPNGEPRDEQHAADLANALSYSGAPEIRALASDCLLKGVPSEKRASIAEMGGLEGVSVWLTETDSALASKALDVFETFQHKRSRAALLNCHEELPSALKGRAAKLYADLSN
jgi:hypothetical protein